MSNPFAAAALAAAATLASIAGETFAVQPTGVAGNDVNGRRVNDPDRAPVASFLAAWSAAPSRAMAGPSRTAGIKPELPGHIADRPFISFPLSRLPYALKRGDRITRLRTSEQFTVAEVVESTTGHVRIDLARA